MILHLLFKQRVRILDFVPQLLDVDLLFGMLHFCLSGFPSLLMVIIINYSTLYVFGKFTSVIMFIQ